MGTGTRFPISVHVIVHNTTGANSPTVKQSQAIYINVSLVFVFRSFLYILNQIRILHPITSTRPSGKTNLTPVLSISLYDFHTLLAILYMFILFYSTPCLFRHQKTFTVHVGLNRCHCTSISVSL